MDKKNMDIDVTSNLDETIILDGAITEINKSESTNRRATRSGGNNKSKGKNQKKSKSNNKKIKKNKKGGKWNPFNWKTWQKILSIICILLLIFATIFYAIPKYKASKPLSFMVVGLDTDEFRDGQVNGERNSRTDSIMVATYNPNRSKIEMTSIPRDTSVDYQCTLQGRDVRDQINELYSISDNDLECLKDTVSNFLNVPIDYYVKVDMAQVETIIDTIGGVELEAFARDGSFCQYTTDSKNEYCFEDGEIVNMMGEEAMTYARFRKDSGKDYDRGRRQQQVVGAMMSKILSGNMTLDTILGMFKLVETDIPIVMMHEYYKYVTKISEVVKMIQGKEEVNSKVLGKKEWLRLFEEVEYLETKVNDETVKGFIEKANEDPAIKVNPFQLFITNHQFENDKINGGWYVAVPEERYAISNALRLNLGLKEETPPEYKNDFGRLEYPEDDERNPAHPNYVKPEIDVEEEVVPEPKPEPELDCSIDPSVDGCENFCEENPNADSCVPEEPTPPEIIPPDPDVKPPTEGGGGEIEPEKPIEP